MFGQSYLLLLYISIESGVIGRLDARSMILKNWTMLERGMNKRFNETSFNANYKVTAEIRSTNHKVPNFFDELI